MENFRGPLDIVQQFFDAHSLKLKIFSMPPPTFEPDPPPAIYNDQSLLHKQEYLSPYLISHYFW